MGIVEERELSYIGSGSPKVKEYFSALNIVSQAREYLGSEGKTTNEDALRVSLEALKYAQERDIYSSGLDLIVLTPEGITDHADNLKDDFKKRIERIQRIHKQLKQS